MGPKISIVVPVYNAEKYLSECLNSILEQSYTNYEIILINDGSTDNSLEVCRSFANRDKRIILINDTNHGVSHARNVALSKATGEWVTFIDSDDWIEKDYLSTLVYYATNKGDIDVVAANFFFNYEDGTEKKSICSRKEIHKAEFPSLPESLMVEDSSRKDNIDISVEVLSAACNKLTRIAFLQEHSISFKEDMKLNEDGLFHLTCFIKAKDFVIIDKPLYHYRIYHQSSNNRYRPDVFKQISLWHKYFGELSKYLERPKEFMSLCAYRSAILLIKLDYGNRFNPNSLYKRSRMLKLVLKDEALNVITIPKQLKKFKRIEMFLLKHKCSLLLIISSNLKGLLKKH